MGVYPQPLEQLEHEEAEEGEADEQQGIFGGPLVLLIVIHRLHQADAE